jgi:hypothetical protein
MESVEGKTVVVTKQQAMELYRRVVGKFDP